MAYEGDLLIACPGIPYNFTQAFAVVVSGDGPNFCGHLLLNVGLADHAGFLHVAGVYTQPRVMDESGFEKYLSETGKRELKRFRVFIDKPNAAMLKIEQLLSVDWLWGVLPHNGASFVEEVVKAGGSSASLYFNCPALERFQ